MRFKPMPRYEQGAVYHPKPPTADSPVGTLFIQPRVDTREQSNVLLDDVIGLNFAVLCWNNNPRALLGEEAYERWKALGARFIAARPQTQLFWTGHDADHDDGSVVIVGDCTGALKSWFDVHAESVLVLRPDRCIAGADIAQRAPELSAALFDVLHLMEGGVNGASSPVLYVPQPTAESSGTVG